MMKHWPIKKQFAFTLLFFEARRADTAPLVFGAGRETLAGGKYRPTSRETHSCRRCSLYSISMKIDYIVSGSSG